MLNVVGRLFKKIASFLCLGLIFFPFFFLEANVFLPKKVSQIALPVNYSSEELAKSLNRIFRVVKQSIVFVDDSFTNNNNDNIKIKSIQTADIQVTIEDGVVKTFIPLLTEATFLFKKKINLNFFFFQKEINLKLTRNLDFKMNVTFKTTIEQNQQLEVVPQTTWKFEWETIPFVSFIFFSISIGDQVSPIINNFLKNYAKRKINQKIIEKVDLNRIFNDINKTLSQPILINEKYGVYSYVDLVRVKSTPFVLDNNSISLNLTLEVYPYFSFSEKTLNESVFKNKKLKIEKEIANKDSTKINFLIYPIILISPLDWQNIIFNQLGEKNFNVGEKSLAMKINEIYSRKNLNTFQFEVFLRGRSTQTILQKVVLVIDTSFYYNRIDKLIELVNFSYLVDTKSVVLRIANFFNQKNFEVKLKNDIEVELNYFLEEIKDSLKKIKKMDVTKQSILNLNIKKIEIIDLEIVDEILAISFLSNGETNLELQDLF